MLSPKQNQVLENVVVFDTDVGQGVSTTDLNGNEEFEDNPMRFAMCPYLSLVPPQEFLALPLIPNH